MPRKPFFKTNPQDPKPLTYTIERKVRFDELDPMGIMWHGNYASFFEEARVALGDYYGIGYLDFAANNTTMPLKRFFVDFIAPLEFNKTYKVKAILHWNIAPILNYEYQIYSQDNKLMTTGYSVHMILDKKNEILLIKPPFFEDFCSKWEKGLLK